MNKITDALFKRITSLSLAEKWDNVGVILTPPLQRPISKVFLTIDLTTNSLQEAINDAAIGVIIAYHPPLFKPIKTLTDHKSNLLLLAAVNGIGVISPHTALDNMQEGINDWLASAFVGSVSNISQMSQPVKGHENAGIGRIITLKTPLEISEIVSRVKKFLGLEHLRLSNVSKSPIRTIAICAGSGSGVKADLFYTGEMSHHDVLAANAQGTSVILCEHSNTERGYLQVLKTKLEDVFKEDGDDIQVAISSTDRDPLVIV